MWEDFEFPADRVPNIKLALHIGQILFGFVSWCLEIVVFRAEGSAINGNVGWTFAVFFLSIPVWIYLIGAPRSPRARHLAEPHVMVALDAIYTIIWLSAFATQAAYNTANMCGTACGASKAIVGLGFFVCLFFAATTFLSMYSLKYYQFQGRLPGYDRLDSGVGPAGQNIDPDKAAFSMAPHGSGEDAYAPIHGRDDDPIDPREDEHGGPYSSTAYGGGAASQQQSYSSAAGRHGGAGTSYGGYGDDPYDSVGGRHQRRDNPFDQGRNDNNPFGDDHSGYTPPPGGAAGTPSPGPGGIHGRVSPNPVGYVAPTAHDAYDDSRPAQFPAANYDRTLR